MWRHEADKEHPWALVAARTTQPRNRRVADCFVIGVVAGVAGADLAKPYDVVSRSRNRIAHRSPHLSNPFGKMHGMMLAVEAGRIMAIAVVQLADGFDPHVCGLQARAPAWHAAVVAHRIVPVADLMDVASGRQTCTRGYADGAGRIGCCESGATCGEAIDIRRSHDRVTGARHRASLMLVGDDEDEIFCLHGLAPGPSRPRHHCGRLSPPSPRWP